MCSKNWSLSKCIWSLALIAVFSCDKKEEPEIFEENLPATIDVSKLWWSDQHGNLITAPGDMQWGSQVFSEVEINLFNSLDTTNLAGTINPPKVVENQPSTNYPYPNPFHSSHILSIPFEGYFEGDIVIKGVVVDSTLTPMFKLAARLKVSDDNITLAIRHAVPLGRYRFYYTLSSQANPHFYKSWGNIRKLD